MEKDENRHYRLIAVGLGFFYCLYYLSSKMDWHFIDNVDLIIHEAGHVIFSLFGHTLYVAGGSIFQVLVPAVFFGYFFINRSYFSAAAMSFWTGLSFINVAVYAADAVKMQLPLLTGDTEGHDWNQLLFQFGMLHYTKFISNFILALGVICIFAGLILAIYKWYYYEQDESYVTEQI